MYEGNETLIQALPHDLHKIRYGEDPEMIFFENDILFSK